MNLGKSKHEGHGNPNGLTLLAKNSRIPLSRIQYQADSDPSLIATIQLGVLFVMAFWSGQSVLAFIRLTDIISRTDALEQSQVVVIDTDGAPAFYDLPEFWGKLHGYGEVAWIKDGVIQCTSGKGFSPSCFEANTKALLESSTRQQVYHLSP